MAVMAAVAIWAVAAPATADDDVVVTGSGWGHGVGLSQYGAKGMADEGKTATQILQHFFQGTSVTGVSSAIPGSWILSDPEPLWVNLLSSQSATTVTAVGGTLTVCQNEPSNLVLREGPEPSPYVQML